MNYEKIIENIRKRLSNYIRDNKLESLVLGVSGGIDSCLCTVLARPVCDSIGIPLIGRSLPIESNKQDEINRAKITGEIFCTHFTEEHPDQVYQFISIINHDPIIGVNSGRNINEWKIRNGNIKARLRMIYLYNLAATNKGMVLCTDNYTEYLLGFWTLHGDVGDYGMIQKLYKTEVYDMAEWIADNENWWGDMKGNQVILDTINAVATDGLGVNDLGDLAQILPNWNGTSREGYKEVDRILKIWNCIRDVNVDNFEIIDNLRDHPVIQRHQKTQYKRNNPVVIDRNLIIE
jgi:NAD+ synthase